MTKNLFQAVKTYINGVEVGETFTTKHLIEVVGDHETLTWWKDVNQNPFYRTHTYKSYLRRTGFLSSIKRGEWKVEKHIPESYNLGTIEFLIGYKGKTYNGLTREEILNPKFKEGDILEFDGEGSYSAEKGARAIYVGVNSRDELIDVTWIRDGKDKKQSNGGYFESMFTKVEDRLEKIIDGETTQQFLSEIGMEGQMLSQLIMTQPIEEIRYLVEERENLDKIRILSEIKEDKIMKVEFDFVEGIGRIKKYLENSLQLEEEFLFRDVKLCNDKDDLKQVLVEYELTERRIEQAIECLGDADNISEVLRAVEDTTLSGLDETVIGLLFNVDITIL
jgi:hypothetical protein